MSSVKNGMAIGLALSAALTASCGDSGTTVLYTGVAVTLPSSDTAMCVALGVDYHNKVGLMSVVGLPSMTVVKDILPGAVGGDPVLRTNNGKLYVVNRLEGNITEVTPTGVGGDPWEVNKQFSVGATSNPQDIAFDGDLGYVVAYASPQVQVWDLSQGTPTTPVTTIDLSSTTIDPDGNPDAQSIYIQNHQAYVTLDVLNGTTPRGNGKIAVIDTTANTLTSTFELNYADPYNFLLPFQGELLVVSDGDFSGTTGCLEQISTGATPAAGPCLIENSAFSASIGVFAVTDTNDLYFVVSSFDPVTFAATATLRKATSDGTVAPVSLTAPSETPSDLQYVHATNQLIYGDSAAGGLRVFDIATQAEVTTSALDLGLSPDATNGIVCLDL